MQRHALILFCRKAAIAVVCAMLVLWVPATDARLAASQDASGIYHANDEGDERVNDIVAAIRPYVSVKPDVRYVPIDEARSKMGLFAEAMALDLVVRSPRARALGWAPTLHSVAGNAARLLEEWRNAHAQEQTA